MSIWIEWVRNPVRWFSLIALTALLGGLWIWASAVPSSATSGALIPSPHVGFAAPDFRVESLQGGEFRLSDWRGQVVVVNFWASWCPPCRAEMPALQVAYVADRERGLAIVAVNTIYQDALSDVRNFVEENGLTFPIALDRTGEIARQYQLRALPSTFFIGPDGVIRKVVIGGPLSEATLRSAVQQLLEE